MGVISTPAPLCSDHDTTRFNCGNDTLNDWLIRRAPKNQDSGASRTFVINSNKRVIGYYALASGSVERLAAPGSIARNMPEPVPVVVLGRLVVDVDYQGHRLGAALLKDAMLRTLAVSHEVEIRAMLVHAISDEAKQFCRRYGFQESPIDAMTLMLSIQQLKAHL